MRRTPRMTAFALVGLALLFAGSVDCKAQAALLMEEPYGFFGTLNPTGHDAVYFSRICAETRVKLRRCEPGEMGAVVSRYSDLADYDWVAVSLIPYLYSVEEASKVPARADRATVRRFRDEYHEAHLLSLGEHVPRGGFMHGGWTELIGVAYERRMFAIRFDTTEAQDDAFIAKMNASKNESHFDLFFNNCADFSRSVLNFYFPHSFGRSFFPDAFMTTPKQISHKLVRYGNNHPEAQLQIFEISQIPGYRRPSRMNKSVAESLVTTGYAIPIVVLNPYVAGGLLLDYLVNGRHHSIPKHPQMLAPEDLTLLTLPSSPPENPDSAPVQAHGAAASESDDSASEPTANFGLKEIVETHE